MKDEWIWQLLVNVFYKEQPKMTLFSPSLKRFYYDGYMFVSLELNTVFASVISLSKPLDR